MGAAYGTGKSGVGVASMGVMRPELVMKYIVLVVMAGVLEEEEGKEEASLDFLKGVRSFDSIWEEIMKQEPEEAASKPVIYIVSWKSIVYMSGEIDTKTLDKYPRFGLSLALTP